MPTALSIDNLPAARRESAWRDAVCDAFVRLECTPDRHAPMHGRLEAGTLGDLHVARVVSSPQRVERTRERAAQDDQPFILMSVQLRGRTIVRQGGSEADLTPGCIAFYDTARPYTLTLPSDFDQIVLHLPRQLIQASVPRGLDHMARRLNASDPFAQTILALAPQLLRMLGSAREAMAQRTAAAAMELIALALDSLDDSPDVGAPSSRIADHRSSVHGAAKFHAATTLHSAPGPAADALVWRTRELIGRQLDDTALSPTRLARQVHVSLRRLQEVFQSQGTTLSDCIWDARLEFARGLLASPAHSRESISTVAYRAGFSDVAHFSRRFKQQFGVSQREYRAGLK
jgi:AraC-like DNA-binding protein